MARPLSPEKRNALLQSATLAVAEHGVMATTSAIAKGAGVAEGTLFTYFESKETLFRELYLHLKEQLAQALMPDYPHGGGYEARMAHVFERFVGWGLDNPAGRHAIARLSASGLIPQTTRLQGMEPFLAVSKMLEDGVREGVLIKAPISLLASVFEQIADVTIDHVNQQPDARERFLKLGFQMVWRGITT
ncbi:TetR family transcriptional regulator [Pandoraea pneumonica]|jgi:AcrR family transcriptional regulator|uniref:TetR family transcriptional regulator n=1 Tax=Pandoraea pneumonica TaxID=2508299 RepID=A0A5E4VKU1_9BURK|nr:TetR/AcrR family transcriptional regulator [Pandoraea pneumonica]VVE12801.1 TetR family transcriptional regulator [Pandoraea pneumonica]